MKPDKSSDDPVHLKPQYLVPKKEPPFKTKTMKEQTSPENKIRQPKPPKSNNDANSVTFDITSLKPKGDSKGGIKPAISRLDETELTSTYGSKLQRTTGNWRSKRNRMELYDLQKRFSFDEIKTQKIKSLTEWAQQDTKGIKKTLYLKQIQARNDLILHVQEQSRLEKLANFQDRWPLMSFRKVLQKIRIYINMTAFKIIKHKVFDNICITIILVNSISLGMEDPEQVGTTQLQTNMENIFLALYSVEMVLKILGLGFVFNKGAYLRDPWNILDFIIVMSAYLTIFQDLASSLANGGATQVQTYDSPKEGGLSLNSLRAFRVLRPLRAITSIKGLQVLVLSVLSALPLLQDTILVLMSFFLVFSIACVQILSGLLKNRCVNIETGLTYQDPGGDDQYLCGGHNVCPEGYFCGKQNENPDANVTNFDNLLYALIVIFYCITMEGWSTVMIYYQMAFTDASVMIFLPMVFIGAFFLLNLLLAVVNSSFSVKNAELQHKLKIEKEKNRTRKKPVRNEDFLDESEPILEIGVKEYWITKRATHQMILFLRKAQARNAALALELKHQIKYEAEEPAPFVLQLPEEFVPEIEETKKDEMDSRSDYSGQLQKYLLELQQPNPGPVVTSSKEPQEIASFAVNDFKTANRRQKREKQSKGIVTDNRLARIQDRKVNLSIKELNDLEIFQYDENASKNSSGQHPFDLSYVHSQEADYPDFSDDEAFVKRERQHVSNDAVSAIASDSSFADIFNEKYISDEDAEAKSIQRNKKIKKVPTFELTERSTSQGQNTTTAIGAAEDRVRKRAGKKKRGAKAKAVATKVKATVDVTDKFHQFKTLIRNKDSEFISMLEDKDPYSFINKKVQKIEINSGMPYRSTSADEVFEIRNQIAEALTIQENNNYIKAKMPACYVEPDQNIQEILQDYIKPYHEAHQLKTVYNIHLEEEVEFDNDDDDALILAIQPFDTVMSVGYGQYLTHKPVKFVARRSDIIVSSTLSITLTPADSEYRPLDKGLLTSEQLSLWCSKRCEFRGNQVKVSTLNFEEEHPEWFEDPQMLKMNTISAQKYPGSAKSLAQSDAKSVGKSTEGKFNTQSVGPKPKMIPPTLLTKPLPPDKLNLLSDEEKRLYYIQKSKYDTYMRILEKRRLTNEEPALRKFNLSEVEQLLQGKHHEDDIEDDDETVQEELNLKYMGRDESFKNQALKHFEEEAYKILAPKRNEQRPKFQYVPAIIKSELDVPGDLEGNSINFNEVLKKDCAVKRKTPRWSGQDVLEIGLNNELSQWVVEKINEVRVWPKGWMGYIKKARVFLKMVVKHKLFDNTMLACVLLNTVVMGMQRYNMDPATTKFSEDSQLCFTWIFIGEMTAKLIAIGPAKYVSDKMNWLDGSVVSLSIIELLMEAVGGGGGNLSAFKTVRVFRTFRVLRVARLLRALKSMQVIIAVVARSAGSFVYITLLMFVFIFIYTLLGMQLFGGQFNFEDGVPRGNYDSFIIAFLTVFQVLTTENWNTVLFDSMRNDSMSRFIPALYYVSWIFIGNYILLNLFLAILLDGFVTEDDEEIQDNEEMIMLERESRRMKIEKEKQRRLKKLGASNLSTSALYREEHKKITEDHIDDIDDLDEQMIREIFLDEGLIKKKDKAREERLLFLGVDAVNSLYVFHKKNKFRILCYKIYKNKIFDNFIMVLIALSSLKLALNSYLPNNGSTIDVLSENIDIFVNVCFLCEMLIKIISLGYVMDNGSYLRDSWNQLDGFIVFTSMLDMIMTNVNIPIIKVLRLLRTLRPLRVISHNIAMKLIVASLFESMGAIFNVIIVITCVWLMFAIFAVNIFAGKLFYCDIGPYTYHTKYDCNVSGGSWVRFAQNFDDIFQAMMTLFDVASIEGWPDVMVSCLDVVDVDVGPTKEYSNVNGFFFLIFILIGSFFLLNFFVGVLFMKYTQAAKNEQKGFTQEHLTWIAIQKMIIEQRCEHAIMNKPDAIAHPKRLYYWNIVTSLPFEILILSVIVLNIIQMGIQYETQSHLYTELLNYSNYFFTAFFFGEMYLKMRAFSFRYFETAWNKFDCFIVTTSLLDIVISLIPNTSGALSAFPQMIRILRVLRVTRIIRLAKKNKGLQALMATITLSVSALFNVFVLLVLVLFIFSVLAIFFFSGVHEGQTLSDYRNFETFGSSFLSMFVFSTGENWNIAMFDCMITPPNCTEGVNCGTSYAPIFWIIFVVFVQNVMLNLFILVIITQFETYYMSDDNPISKFKKSLDVFMVTWISFTQTRYRCLKLREKKITDFFKQLPMPLGLPIDTTEDQMKKVMLKMGIRCDDGYVYFNELLYRCMRRQYGSFRLNRRMQIHEVTCQYQIYKITVKQQSISLKTELHEHYFKQMVGNGKSVNPFLLNMYFYISFNTWLNYTRKNQKRERHYLKQEKLRNKCVAANKPYHPEPFEEEQEPLQFVTIEVDEPIMYTSEEANSNDEDSSPESKPQQLSLTKKPTLRFKNNKVSSSAVFGNKSASVMSSIYSKR